MSVWVLVEEGGRAASADLQRCRIRMLAARARRWNPDCIVDPHRIRILRNPIQAYPWGSRTAIPELLGEPSPSARPQAELWIGAHPKAPSLVLTEEGEVPLDAWIARDPESVLGRGVAKRFGGRLPFLFKVLAADRPLSIQAHPNPEQARAGFERENAAGIPLDAPNRCYGDPNHKPELICALSSFHALNRFRAIEEIVSGFETLGVTGLRPLLERLRKGPDHEGLGCFFVGLMTLPAAARDLALARASQVAGMRSGNDATWEWVRRLGDLHAGDMGVLAPLLLNVVDLAPGEAMFLPAGELHAYLQGVGIELMASSDNVLRGGLTSKHVAIPELVDTLTFRRGAVDLLTAMSVRPGESTYVTPVEEFQLSVLEVRPGREYFSRDRESVEILFCSSGEARIRTESGEDGIKFRRGRALLVSGVDGSYAIAGDATLYRASVPVVGPGQRSSDRSVTA